MFVLNKVVNVASDLVRGAGEHRDLEAVDLWRFGRQQERLGFASGGEIVLHALVRRGDLLVEIGVD